MLNKSDEMQLIEYTKALLTERYGIKGASINIGYHDIDKNAEIIGLGIAIHPRLTIAIYDTGTYKSLYEIVSAIDAYIRLIKPLFRFSGKNFILNYNLYIYKDKHNEKPVISKFINYIITNQKLNWVADVKVTPSINTNMINGLLVADALKNPLEALMMVNTINKIGNVDVIHKLKERSDILYETKYNGKVYFKIYKLNGLTNPHYDLMFIIDENMEILNHDLTSKILQSENKNG